MTRATSVIGDCINKLKIRGKQKNEPKREKGDTAESILVKKVVRRSPSCRSGDDGLGYGNPMPALSDTGNFEDGQVEFFC